MIIPIFGLYWHSSFPLNHALTVDFVDDSEGSNHRSDVVAFPITLLAMCPTTRQSPRRLFDRLGRIRWTCWNAAMKRWDVPKRIRVAMRVAWCFWWYFKSKSLKFRGWNTLERCFASSASTIQWNCRRIGFYCRCSAHAKIGARCDVSRWGRKTKTLTHSPTHSPTHPLTHALSLSHTFIDAKNWQAHDMTMT